MWFEDDFVGGERERRRRRFICRCREVGHEREERERERFICRCRRIRHEREDDDC